MPEFIDDEFGTIVIRRSHLARSIKLSVAPNGSIRVSMPRYAPQLMAKRLLNSSRESVRELLSASGSIDSYTAGMQIGKSHTLVAHQGSGLKVRRHGQIIEVTLAPDQELSDRDVHAAIRTVVQDALRKEAKSYLPKRLAYLATQHGFSYTSLRFSHASTRWGSCSSNGTISLNIALMKLDFELIDYVLLHELTHTIHMNHSQAFWTRLQASDPSYKAHRAALKNESPTI